MVASDNRGKLEEYRELLNGVPWRMVLLAERGIPGMDLETGNSFDENASLKARGYARVSGLPALADDSGLEVDALGGRPGVYSARYGGKTSDSARNTLLLDELQGVAWDRRTACFRCVIAVHTGRKEDDVLLFQGSCRGIICLEPRGEHGFGYDPIFYLPEYSRTMAELTPEEKNRVSHRAMAAQKCRPVLVELSQRHRGN